ncbi:MAG: ATP synthase F1 subunit delta [Eubacteriales bacterium]
MTQTAKTYGDSLYQLAREEGLTDQILPQLSAVVAIFKENPEFLTLLQLPSLPKKERVALVDEAFCTGLHPYLLNFLKILTENATVSQFEGCAQEYIKCYNVDNHILEATAVTAKPLGEELTKKLQEKLEKITGKTVQLSQKVDSNVLGGIRLELDGAMMDGTIQTRLSALKAQLKSTVL